MASLKQISLVAGSIAIAAALAGTVPAAAQEFPAGVLEALSTAETAGVSTEIPEEAMGAEAPVATTSDEATEATAEPLAAEADPVAPVASEPVSLADAAPVITGPITTAATSLNTGELSVGEPVPQVAQASRPLFQGAPSFYLGIGGNIGLANSAQSAIGQFGFAGISKVSFGPRFSLRPALLINSTRTAVTVPITYNFDPTQVGGFTVYPFLGGGVDVPFNGNVGLLVNGGIDVPISQRFTFNATTNIRASGGFGLGVILGVGYNFPVFFD